MEFCWNFGFCVVPELNWVCERNGSEVQSIYSGEDAVKTGDEVDASTAFTYFLNYNCII